MKLNSVRLLVKNFDDCYRFYNEKLGLKATFGKPGEVYASFEIGLSSGISIFYSDLMSQAIGNFEKDLPQDKREKFCIEIAVDSVDKAYAELSEKGVTFINKPVNMKDWGMRVVHLRDPEDNLIELFSDLTA
jgi:lactoylglutathione lyase